MFKYWLLLSLLLPCLAQANADELAQAMLREADSYRQNSDEVKVSVRISLFKNNELDKEQRYDVFIKPDRQTLVIGRSPLEIGQKVLMLDDKFWLVLPKTKRPIRITPMQKLLGEASTGDIATMRWNEDYKATLSAHAKDAESGLHELILTAKRKGVTYKKILLSLDPQGNQPVRAELYLASGKLAKVANFGFEGVGDQRRMVTMTLRDKIKRSQYTDIEYLSSEPYQLPKKFYNPAYLAKNPRLQL